MSRSTCGPAARSTCRPGIGPFRLVTMGRSFHWMDRAATLAILDKLVTPGGVLAFFGDDHPRTAENAWRRMVTEVGERYGRDAAPHLMARKSDRFRGHVSMLLDSPFRRLHSVGEYIRREITVDDAVGLAFSLSTSSPEALGEKRDAFETELRAELAKLAPDGRLAEIAEMSAVIAGRD